MLGVAQCLQQGHLVTCIHSCLCAVLCKVLVMSLTQDLKFPWPLLNFSPRSFFFFIVTLLKKVWLFINIIILQYCFFPLFVFSDLNWSWFDPHLLSTCSMDQFIYIWDLRSEGGVDNIISSKAGGQGGSVAPPPKQLSGVSYGFLPKSVKAELLLKCDRHVTLCQLSF